MSQSTTTTENDGEAGSKPELSDTLEVGERLNSWSFIRVVASLLVAMLSGCSQFFFYPTRELVAEPDAWGLEYRDLSIEVSDKVVLHGWELKEIGAYQGTVVFFHGNAQNIANHLPSVSWLPQHGYRVVTVDYRGYGKSTGKITIQGAREDAKAVINKIANRDGPVIAFGQSLGAAITLSVAPELEGKIAAVVADSAFVGYRALAREKIGQFWLTYPLAWPLSLTIPSGYDPALFVPNISPVPVLFVHGSKDDIVPARNSEELYLLASEPKKLMIVPGARHIAALGIEEHQAEMLSFLATSCSN